MIYEVKGKLPAPYHKRVVDGHLELDPREAGWLIKRDLIQEAERKRPARKKEK